jgi:hypothetical protein
VKELLRRAREVASLFGLYIQQGFDFLAPPSVVRAFPIRVAKRGLDRMILV